MEARPWPYRVLSVALLAAAVRARRRIADDVGERGVNGARDFHDGEHYAQAFGKGVRVQSVMRGYISISRSALERHTACRPTLRDANVLPAQAFLGASEGGDVTFGGGRFGAALRGAMTKRDFLVAALCVRRRRLPLHSPCRELQGARHHLGCRRP